MAARQQEGQHGQPRHNPKHHQHGRQNSQHFGKSQQLPGQFLAQFLLGGGAGDEDARRRGSDQGGNLRHQAVADGEQGEALQGLVDRHAPLHDADGKSAQDIDERDQNGGDGVAAHKFARAVHRPVKIGFLLDLAAALAGLGFVDDSGVEFGVNRHLLAGHGVEGEPRGHFGDAARALGDDDEIDQRQNQENDQADDIIAAHHKIAERLDDVPRIAVEQDQAGGGDVEGKAVKRDEQQQGGKAGEFGRFLHVKDGKQDEQGEGDADRQKGVQEKRPDGQDHQHDRAEQPGDQEDVALFEEQAQIRFRFGLRHDVHLK
jgi:hypothetical protein